jgi:hypothetical protein
MSVKVQPVSSARAPSNTRTPAPPGLRTVVLPARSWAPLRPTTATSESAATTHSSRCNAPDRTSTATSPPECASSMPDTSACSTATRSTASPTDSTRTSPGVPDPDSVTSRSSTIASG